MRHTVLVIDDQWSMQELARIVLQKAGYRVLLAGDATTGLSLARIERPDVILLDMRLHGRTGLHLLRGLRQDGVTARIPVVLITNSPQDIRRSSGLDAAGARYLQKPFAPPALLGMIERTLHPQPHSLPYAV